MGRRLIPLAIAMLACVALPATALGSTPAVGSSSAAVVRQDDGKIVTIGNGPECAGALPDCAPGFGVSRLDASGARDPSFGSAGFASSGIADASPVSVALDDQGRILLVGTSFPPAGGRQRSGIVLARFTPAGALDPGFGSGGVVSVDLPDASLDGRGVVVAGGRIFVSTTYRTDAGVRFATARLGDDGRLDSSFGAGGIAIAPVAPVSPNYAGPIAVQPDGKVLVGAVAGKAGTSRLLAVVRFNADGSIDSGFAEGGVFSGNPVIDSWGSLTLESVFADAGGRILLAGSERLGEHSPTDAIVIRLDANGRIDTSFGEGGDGDGDVSISKAVLVSAVPLTGDSVFLGLARRRGVAIARLGADGRLDPTFNAGGKGTVSVAGLTTVLEAALPLPEGGAVALASVKAAHCRVPGPSRWRRCASQATIAYKPNGFLRGDFGGVGFLTRPPIHYCRELPGTLCGIDMTKGQLEGLVGRGSPRKAHLKLDKVTFRVRCDRRVETHCRISTGVRLGPGQGFTSKTVTVKAGKSRPLRLPAPAGLAARLADAGAELKLPLRQRVTANGISVAYAAGIRLLRR